MVISNIHEHCSSSSRIRVYVLSRPPITSEVIGGLGIIHCITKLDYLPIYSILSIQ